MVARRGLVTRVALIAAAAVVAIVVGLLVWYESTSYRPRETEPAAQLLTGATVLTGPELAATDGVDVLVRDGLIAAIGPGLDDAAPADVERHDLTGMTLMPGLIDLHVHLGVERDPEDQQPGVLDLPRTMVDYARYLPGARRDLLSSGVTTVRDLGNETPFIYELRDGVEDGTFEGPRVVAAGPVFTTVGGHPVQTVHGGDVDASPVMTPRTPEEARAQVRQVAADGADLIKVVQERGGGPVQLDPIPTEILDAIVAQAHAQGLRVTGHWGRLEDLAELRGAGVDGLEHLESRDLLDGWPPGVLEGVVASGLPLTATMVVASEGLPPDAMDLLRQRVGEFHDAGGLVVAGSDAGMPGVGFGDGLQRELANLVEIGMTPTQALQAATSEAASVLGRPDLGVIREGAVADLVAVEGRPYEHIGDVTRVRLVLRDGRVTLDETSPQAP